MTSHSQPRTPLPKGRLIAVAVVAIGAVTAASSGMAASENPSTSVVTA
jgi:hypothetical protein